MRLFYFNHTLLLFTCTFSSFLCAYTQKLGLPYFYVPEGQEKCFSEEARRDMTITVSYTIYDNPGITCTVTIRDHRKKPLTSKDVTQDKPQGRIGFFVKHDGEYFVCVFCNISPWFSAASRKWSLSVDMGDYILNTTEITKAEELKNSENLIESIHRKLKDIQKENIYQRRQEEKYRTIYDQINSHVIKFAVLEVVIMAGVTAFAILHLSRYFHAQKLY